MAGLEVYLKDQSELEAKIPGGLLILIIHVAIVKGDPLSCEKKLGLYLRIYTTIGRLGPFSLLGSIFDLSLILWRSISSNILVPGLT